MNRFKFVLIFLLYNITILQQAIALEIPTENEFKIKKISQQKILYANHKDRSKHISNTTIKLVQYYLLNENKEFEVIFPQFSISNKNSTKYAIAYKGNAKETKNIKHEVLKEGLFASYIYKGSYVNLKEIIPFVYKKIKEDRRYIPDPLKEIRLLYWNSIDDNHPKDLITEIQIKLKAIN